MTKKRRRVRAAGYIRVSTPGQVSEGASLQVQEAAIYTYAAAYGYELVGIYRDEGISGGHIARPALDRLRADARGGKFEAVIFKRLARFGRNTRDLLSLYGEFEDEYKIELISIDEGIKTSTSIGKLLRNVLASIAEFERDLLTTRMNEVRLYKLRRMEIYCGMAPYGYRFDKTRERMVVIAEEKEAYLLMVELYLKHNLSAHAITQHLDALGIATRGGKKWRITTIMRILREKAYTGSKVINKHRYCLDGKFTKILTIKGERGAVPVLKPTSEWITFPFPKIIEEERWQQVQRKIALCSARRRETERNTDKFFVAGLITCGYCGAKVYGRTREPQHGKCYYYYRCSWFDLGSKARRERGREEPCFLSGVDMSTVDDFVWSVVADIIASPEQEFIKFATTGRNQVRLGEEKAQRAADISAIERKIERHLEQIGNISNRSTRDLITRKVNALAYERETALRAIDTIERQLGAIDTIRAELGRADYREDRISLRKALSILPDSVKKHIIREILTFEDNDAHPITLKLPESWGGKSPLVKSGKFGFEVVDIELFLSFNLRLDKVLRSLDYIKDKGFIDSSLALSITEEFKSSTIMVSIRRDHTIQTKTRRRYEKQ